MALIDILSDLNDQLGSVDSLSVENGALVKKAAGVAKKAEHLWRHTSHLDSHFIYIPLLHLVSERLLAYSFDRLADTIDATAYTVATKMRRHILTPQGAEEIIYDALLKIRLAEEKLFFNRFREVARTVSVREDDVFEKVPGIEGGYALRFLGLENIEAVTGKLMFRSDENYNDRVININDFIRHLVGFDALAPFIGKFSFQNGEFYLTLKGDKDLEYALHSGEYDDSVLFGGIAHQLMMHSWIQNQFFNNSDANKTGRTITYTRMNGKRGGFISCVGGILTPEEITITVPNHNYIDEMMASMILRREGEDNRLAQKYEVNDGKRVYVSGREPHVDRLVEAGQKFISQFLITRLERYTREIADLDVHPANYLMDGKIIDIEKLGVTNGFYSAAQLLGHPAVRSFQKRMDGKGINEFDLLEKFAQGHDYELIRRSCELASQYSFGGTKLYDLFMASKIIQYFDFIPPGFLEQAKDWTTAAMGWINAFHVFSYECRRHETKPSLDHLGATLDILGSEKRFEEFTSAYVTAIMQWNKPSHTSLICDNYPHLLSLSSTKP